MSYFKGAGAFVTAIFSVLLISAGPVFSLGIFNDKISEKIYVKTDDSGSKLVVNGKDYFVKGVVWGAIPVGSDYSYSLWNKSDEFIRNVLEADMKLLTNAGFNAIRVFTQIPPAWIEYIYDHFGIRTVVFDMMDTYANPEPDFGSKVVKDRLLRSVRDMAITYKKTRGLLFYALGNEQNYHVKNNSNLVNMYKLYEKCVREIRNIDRNHPTVIVNGDTKNITMVRDLVPGLELFGANVYRGATGGSVYAEVKISLKKPFVFTEFGCDSFNSYTKREDQARQAEYITSQWKELYLNTYGKGKGNCLGGFVFQWRDEWWKSENPLVHDKTANWQNPAYAYDSKAGNNMNEEWFGICSLSPKVNSKGFHQSLPKRAYRSLSKILKLDPYQMDAQEIRNAFVK